MKYFQLFVDVNYIPPSPIGWYGKLDGKTLEGKRAYEMPKHSLFLVEAHQQMVFTDVITFPCFLISEKVKEILQKYDSSISYMRVIFYDQAKGKSKAYYLPFLEEIEADRKENGDSTQRAVSGLKGLRNRAIFKLRENNQTKIIIRLDLLESILRRETLGIGVKEISIVD